MHLYRVKFLLKVFTTKVIFSQAFPFLFGLTASLYYHKYYLEMHNLHLQTSKVYMLKLKLEGTFFPHFHQCPLTPSALSHASNSVPTVNSFLSFFLVKFRKML